MSQLAAKRQIVNIHNQSLLALYDSLMQNLSPKLQRSIQLSCEKGSSSWLTTLPLEDQGCALHKGAF